MAQIEIIVGSVYGNAQNVAEHASEFLTGEGHDVSIHTDPDVALLDEDVSFLVISSTTGMGDVPPNLELFFADAEAAAPMLAGKKYAVVGLGDSSYGDSYCGAGKQMFALFEALEGKAIAPMLEVDAMETLEPETDVVQWLSEHKDHF